MDSVCFLRVFVSRCAGDVFVSGVWMWVCLLSFDINLIVRKPSLLPLMTEPGPWPSEATRY